MNDSCSLSDVLGPDTLQELAASSALRRGHEYFEAGAVHLEEVRGDGVSARVDGSEQPAYFTEIFIAHEGGLRYRCSCPVGHTGAFCKHLVATALSWQERGTDKDGGTVVALPSPKDYLETLSREELQALVLTSAERYPDFHRHLRVKAAVKLMESYEEWATLVDWSVPRVDRLQWEEVFEFAQDVAVLADTLEEAATSKSGAPLADAIEYALDGMCHLYGAARDSEGHFATAIRRLQHLHARICAQAQLPAGHIAKYLHRAFAIWNSYSFPIFAGEHYSLLGQEAAFKLLADMKASPCHWAGVDGEDEYWVGEPVLRQVRLELTEMYGTRAQLIEVLLEQMDSEAKALQVHALYLAEGQPERARMFLQETLASGRFRKSIKFIDLRVADCLARSEVDQARRELLGHFQACMDWEAYQSLQAYAKKPPFDANLLGLAKEHLLSAFRAFARNTDPGVKGLRRHMRGLLIRIFLEEGDAEKAWEFYHDDVPTSDLLFRLLRERAESHPEKALSVLQARIAQRVTEGRVLAEYDGALEACEVYRSICDALGLLKQWDYMVAWARAEWPRLRKFQAGLSKLAGA